MGNVSSYENRVIAFVDILGFQSILNNTQVIDEKGECVDNEEYIFLLYKTFERISDLMSVNELPDNAAPSRQVTQFSDSIVISFKIEESAKELRYLLEELLFLHIDLLRKGILMRGGISYGPLIHTNNVLFGPAMVQAYKVESLAANGPRIILPKSLTSLNENLSENLKQQTQNLNELISLDEDDFFYLDYFDKCQNPELNLFVDDSEYIEHLANMRKVIVGGLKNSQPNIYNKYGWMKTKWNRTIKKYQESEARSAQLEDYFKSQPLILQTI